jgi:hypothetical protein
LVAAGCVCRQKKIKIKQFYRFSRNCSSWFSIYMPGFLQDKVRQEPEKWKLDGFGGSVIPPEG